MIRTGVRALFLAAVAACGAVAGAESPEGWRLDSNEEAWRHLPRALAGRGARLPSWARASARDLPRTTAAMLVLDRLHRTKSPLGPVLRGKMRWVAADANHCEYARATAASDLRRVGVSEEEISALKAGPERWPQGERSALKFARQMTCDASTVTDAQVTELKAVHGEEKLVAMVLLIAAANFQDRLILGLGVDLEEGGPLPPLDVKFDPDAQAPPVPDRASPAGRQGPAEPTKVDDPAWREFDFDALKRGLLVQKEVPGRVRVPTYDDVLGRLPRDYPIPRTPIRIRWSLVCLGYQPELAAAWSACTRAFGEEARQDRVFEESLFWIVTRTIHCFY